MFDKLAERSMVIMEISALNKPNWPEFNLKNIKVASIKKDVDTDLGGFDLQAALDEHPEHLFVKVFAIKKDEINDNGDAFSEKELKKAVATFIGVPVFTNHQNDDIEKAKGKVVHAWYDDEKGGIWTINMVDKTAYPKLARGIEEGYVNGTSMGAQVGFSCCSICHNKAHTADEYCSHIKSQKNKKISAKVKCAFHESKCKPTEEECPVCGSKKGEEKYHEHKQAQVHEDNYNIKFIEDSFVVNPACHSCLVDAVLNVPVIQKKVADFKQNLLRAAYAVGAFEKAAAVQAEYQNLVKAASTMEGTTAHDAVRLAKLLLTEAHLGLKQERARLAMSFPEVENAESIDVVKTAGKVEVEKLNEAMGLMEIVARSMFDQKQQVSMEYVSDVVDVLADLQKVTDELVEMGYAQLASPPTMASYVQALQSGQPVTGAMGQAGATTGAVPQQQQQPQFPDMKPPQGGGAGNNNLVTVTKPASSERNLKESSVMELNISERVSALRQKIADALARRATASVHDVSSDTTQNKSKEFEGTMADTTQEKLAAGKGQSDYTQQVTTEKQLEDIKDKGVIHPRTGEMKDGITESKEQLGGTAKTDVQGATANVRLNNSPSVITEKQFNDIKDGYMVRHNEFPEVITEKQWTDMSRTVGSILSESQEQHITEAQIRDLLSHHTWAEEPPTMVTEKQLKDGGFGEQGQFGSLDRLNEGGKTASAMSNGKKLILAAQNALADAIANFNKTPEEVVKAASFINRDPQAIIKASFLTLVNGAPFVVANRKAEVKRTAYFAKVAESRNAISPADALVACMGDNCRGIKAEDFVEAVGFVASDKNLMAKVETLAHEKLANRNKIEVIHTVDKFATLRAAAAELDRPVDGLYQIRATIAEVGVPTTNKVAFANAAQRFARATLAQQVPGVEAYGIELKVNEAKGMFAVTLKEAAKMSDGELKLAKAAAAGQIGSNPQNVKTARANARQGLSKEAQMGGAMGGDPSAMGGGGAGQPAAPMGAPGGGMPGAPAQGVESMTGDEGAEGADDTTDMEPKPPGSVCPVCTSEDVDIVEGKGKCKACTAEFTYKVQIDVTKWPNTLDKGEQQNAEDGAGEGEGFAMPEAGADQAGGAPGAAPAAPAGGAPAGGQMPMAASSKKAPNKSMKLSASLDETPRGFASMVQITPSIVSKVAAIKDRVVKAAGNKDEMALITLPVDEGGLGISIRNQEHIASGNYSLGTISPLTGSTNTKKIASNMHLCLDTGTPYVMETAVAKADIRHPYVQWRWVPKIAGAECSSCQRVKKAFVNALETFGSSEKEFESLDLKSRGEMILAMKQANAFKTIKTASSQIDAFGEFKKAYAVPVDLFPASACREKLARRFGGDSVAMSGPCEGQNLADCVCKTLKKAEVYAEYLAVKVASVWAMPDASESCLGDFIRTGFTPKQAATCCELMKQKYAMSHEHFLEKAASTGITTVSAGIGYWIGGVKGAVTAAGLTGQAAIKVASILSKKAQFGGMGMAPAPQAPTGGMGGAGVPAAPAPAAGGMGAGGMGTGGGCMTDGSEGGMGGAGMSDMGGAPPMGGMGEDPAATDPTAGDPSAGGDPSMGGGDPNGGADHAALQQAKDALDQLRQTGGGQMNPDVEHAIHAFDLAFDAVMNGGGNAGGDPGMGGGDVDPFADQPNGSDVSGGDLGVEPSADDSGEVPLDDSTGDGAPAGDVPPSDAGSQDTGDLTPSDDSKPVDEAPSGDAPSEDGGNPFGDEKPADDKPAEDAGDDSQPEDKGDGSEEPKDPFDDKAEKEKEVMSFASSMKSSTIGKTGRITMNLDSVKAALAAGQKKVAEDGSKLKVETTQDAVPFKFENGGTIGKEKPFSADKPEVKTDESKSKMGNEEPPKAVDATVPTGDQRMGHEGKHLKPEFADKITGGAGGAGGEMGDKVSSTKAMQLRLAERLIAANNKKLETTHPTPTMETADIGKISDMSQSRVGEEQEYNPAEPKNLKGKEGESFRGHEEESINADGKGTGLNEKTAPEIPTADGDPKTTELRGIAANANVGEKSQQVKEATLLAGKLLRASYISPEDLSQTITDLSQYKVAQLKAYESKMFSKTTASTPAKKGLAAVQDGHEGQPVMSFDANLKTPSLANRIAACFSLTKQLDSANDDDAQLRRKYNRG